MQSTYRFSSIATQTDRVDKRASLVFRWGLDVRAASLREGGFLVVGRASPANLIIDDRSLSRVHARFGLERGLIHFEDLQSTNGIVIGKERQTKGVLAPYQRALLGEVEVVGTGSFRHASSCDVPLRDLIAQVESERTRSDFFRRSFAVVAVQSDQPLDLRTSLRPIDVVESYAPLLSVLLLPEASSKEVLSLARSLRGRSATELAVGAAVYPDVDDSAEELVARSIEACRSSAEKTVAFVEPGPQSVPVEQPILLSKAMSCVHDLLTSSARTTIPVLIVGETGCGKEWLARLVHEKSPRSAGPFVTVNCAALPAGLIAATLFGHERGAFTGAERQSAGLFEQSHRGTLFLDELGELPLEAQAALLRVLESPSFVRVGGHREVQVDVRVVAATHRDLPLLVREGKFREDLLYRLEAFTVEVPPLRERRDEIVPLAEHFLAINRRRWRTLPRSLSADAVRMLVAYEWPGNVRKLRNVIDRASVICAQDTIEVHHLPELRQAMPLDEVGALEQTRADTQRETLGDQLRTTELAAIRRALLKARGNQAEAARLLGIPRRTLSYKVQMFGAALQMPRDPREL